MKCLQNFLFFIISRLTLKIFTEFGEDEVIMLGQHFLNNEKLIKAIGNQHKAELNSAIMILSAKVSVYMQTNAL